MTSDTAVVTMALVLHVVPRLLSLANWRRPAETASSKVPEAAKRAKGEVERPGYIHFRSLGFPAPVMGEMRPWHHPTAIRQPGAALPNHRHHSGLVVALVLLEACLTPQMPAAASDRSALAIAYDHTTTMKMIASHPRGRVRSVHPVGMTMSIRQG